MSSAATPRKPPKVYVSDCEGPISKNDNAFELASKFIPEGNRLFTLISRYDDVLADIVKREGYKAGDTLKLILPFLKAYGITDKTMSEYSSQSILLVPAAKEMLQLIGRFMPSFIVSTSYAQYMQALCRAVNFPFRNVYCTKLDLDRYETSDKEKTRLRHLKDEMVNLPIPEIPEGAGSLKDLPTKTQQTIKRLDEIFWKELSSMEIGRMLKEVDPVGGAEKAAAVNDIATRLNVPLQSAMYVGDSITDVEAFRFVRNGGGLTVSFNGNNFAVREAEVAVLSESAVATAVLADIFNKFGKLRLKKMIREWKPSTIGRLSLHQPLKRRFLELSRDRFPRVELVTSGNMDSLMRESTAFRKAVRGEAIGRLG